MGDKTSGGHQITQQLLIGIAVNAIWAGIVVVYNDFSNPWTNLMARYDHHVGQSLVILATSILMLTLFTLSALSSLVSACGVVKEPLGYLIAVPPVVVIYGYILYYVGHVLYVILTDPKKPAMSGAWVPGFLKFVLPS